MKLLHECLTLQDIFEDPSRWSKGGSRDANGELVNHCSEAVSYCITTAICRIPEDSLTVIEKIGRVIGLNINPDIPTALWDWNDAPERTIEDVQKLVKEAGV